MLQSKKKKKWARGIPRKVSWVSAHCLLSCFFNHRNEDPGTTQKETPWIGRRQPCKLINAPVRVVSQTSRLPGLEYVQTGMPWIGSQFIFIYVYICMCVCSCMCMCLSVCAMCMLVRENVRRLHTIPWSWIYNWLWVTNVNVENQAQVFCKSSNPLNHWVTTPACDNQSVPMHFL